MHTAGYHYEYNLDDNESPIRRMINLIETHAPRLMKTGGGLGVVSEQKRTKPARATTPEERRMVLSMAKTGLYNKSEIARTVGLSQSATWHILENAGLRLRTKDGRK